MSQESVERLRRAFDAFSRGDLDAAVVDAAPEVEYVPSGAIPGQGGVARGVEEYKRSVGSIFDVFDDAHLQPEEFIDAADTVIGGYTLSGRGKESGIEARMTLWQVWRLNDGRFVHGEAFRRRKEAVEAAGLSE